MGEKPEKHRKGRMVWLFTPGALIKIETPCHHQKPHLSPLHFKPRVMQHCRPFARRTPISFPASIHPSAIIIVFPPSPRSSSPHARKTGGPRYLYPPLPLSLVGFEIFTFSPFFRNFPHRPSQGPGGPRPATLPIRCGRSVMR